MKKILTLIGVVFLSITTSFSQVSIVFDGDSLNNYIGQTVTFNQTLHVCGRYGNNLYLSYERLRQPEEYAIIGTAAFDSARATCDAAILTAYCTHLMTDTVRLGATISNLTASVTAARELYVTDNLQFGNNSRPSHRPNVGDARLIICSANLEYYCPIWQDTYGAESDEEFQTQHLKLMKALININADIYSVTEIQDGTSALISITNGLNELTAPGRYAYVQDNDDETTTYTKVGFIYRTDKVTPILQLGHPYSQYSIYYNRQYVQAFRENETNERFVLSMNHFKAKDGTGSESTNPARMDNVEHLVSFLSQQLNNNYYLDEDVLILGDLNCSTMEEPIRYLMDNGYENQLSIYSPTQYSYVYDNEIEYLDHVFASNSMASQVTGAAPYHINADESYSFYYPYGDTTMYRYADHDPIIIGLNLRSEVNTDCIDIDYSETFENSLGNFQTANVTGSSNWFWYSNYNCAYMNGYDSGENDDWLISPSFNMEGKESATLQFSHALGYGSSSSTWPLHCRLMVSTNYQGNVQNASWEELQIPNYPTANWQWVDNEIMIPENYYGQPSFTVAFHYTIDNTQDSPAWEIKNFIFTADCIDQPTGINEPATIDNPVKAYGLDGKIKIESPEPTNVAVFDLVGRTIYHSSSVQNCEIAVNQGVYIVRVGQTTYKVFVPHF